MRYIEIDGKSYDVDECFNCPCYDGGDGGWGEICKHPKGDGVSSGIGASTYPRQVFGPNCPLREKEEFAKGGLVNPVEVSWPVDVTVPCPEEIFIPMFKLRRKEEGE